MGGDEDARAAIERLPENATEPGGLPSGTEEPAGDGLRKPGGPAPAGPHADPALINPEATPGTGALTPPGEQDDVESTSG